MKKKKKWVFPVVSLLVAAFIIALPKLIEASKEGPAEEMNIVSAKAEMKDIDTTISGTGTLTSQESEEIEVPSGVEVTGYLVSNGETVKKGQPLVTVDKISVQEAISACQKTIDYLEEQMFALEYHQSTRYIMVPATGTVTAIYCEKGDDVTDVMLEHGCLATIDIGGEEWKAQAFNGTVQFVNAKVGDTVHGHDTFIWLDDLAETSSYDVLLLEHQDYEELMEKLFRMYQDGVIAAPCDGEISGIDKEKVKKVQNIGNNALLDQLTDIENAEKQMNPDQGFPSGFDPQNMPEDFSPGNPPDFSGQGREERNSPSGRPDSIAAKPASASVAVNDEASERRSVLRVTPLVYEGEKRTLLSAEKAAAFPEYDQGTVTAISDDGVSVQFQSFGNQTLTADNVMGSLSAYTVGDTYMYHITILGDAVFFQESGCVKSAAQKKMEEEMQKKMQEQMMKQMQEQMKKQMQGMMGKFSGMMGSMSALAGMSASQEETFEKYSLDGDVIMSVTPDESLEIVITVDELDILSVSVGQEAQITIDALPGRSYSGTVTKVDSAANVNSGGQTKFSATVTMDMGENLLAGMNAATQITIATKSQILTVPVKALSEEDGKTYVYTGHDSKQNELTGRTEVSTGISDGENVEILSGVSEGETVFFAYKDTIDVDSITDHPGLSMANMYKSMGGK